MGIGWHRGKGMRCAPPNGRGRVVRLTDVLFTVRRLMVGMLVAALWLTLAQWWDWRYGGAVPRSRLKLLRPGMTVEQVEGIVRRPEHVDSFGGWTITRPGS